MRQSYSPQLCLDSQRIDEVPLNLNCRDSMIPVRKALQHVYSKPALTEQIMSLIDERFDMKRDEGDKDVAVREAKSLQSAFNNGVKRLSFDRGFHSPDNQTKLSELVENLCIPKPGAKQSVQQLEAADEEFLAAKQNHSGVESAIGALQSGNAMQRCRDRSEIGFERYLQLGILGRNLHTLGKLLITEENENTAAGQSRRKAA